MIKAVIFDLDGTLLDTIEDLADSMNIVLEKHHFPTHDIHSYKYFVGDGVKEFAARAIPGAYRSDDKLCAAIGAEAMEEYAGRWHNKTRPYDGIPEMLEELSRRKIKKAVLSNKPHDFTILTTRHFFNGIFDEVQGEIPSKRPRKPDPAGVFEILDKFSVGKNETLYLGDTATDMLTAKAAGIYPVGALWGFRTQEELLENGARALISKPHELIELLS